MSSEGAEVVLLDHQRRVPRLLAEANPDHISANSFREYESKFIGVNESISMQPQPSTEQRAKAESFGRQHLTGLVTLLFTDMGSTWARS